MSARRAAERILDAAERGEAHVILSLQANLLERFYALAPRTTTELLALVDRFLPRGDGSQTHRLGHESTTLVDRAGFGALGAGERDRMHELLDTPPSANKNCTTLASVRRSARIARRDGCARARRRCSARCGRRNVCREGERSQSFRVLSRRHVTVGVVGVLAIRKTNASQSK